MISFSSWYHKTVFQNKHCCNLSLSVQKELETTGTITEVQPSKLPSSTLDNLHSLDLACPSKNQCQGLGYQNGTHWEKVERSTHEQGYVPEEDLWEFRSSCTFLLLYSNKILVLFNGMSCHALLQTRQQLSHESCTRISKSVNQIMSFVNISDELSYFIIVSESKYKCCLISMSFCFPIQKREKECLLYRVVLRMSSPEGRFQNKAQSLIFFLIRKGKTFDHLPDQQVQNILSTETHHPMKTHM